MSAQGAEMELFVLRVEARSILEISCQDSRRLAYQKITVSKERHVTLQTPD
jgi:hypothetical protein